MSDTVTADLKQTLMETGNDDSTWGDVANANFQRLEDKQVKHTALSVTGGTVTLNDAQELVSVIDITGVLVGIVNIVFSGRKGFWIINNQATLGAFYVVCKVSGQTGVGVPTGTATIVYCDGVDIKNALPALGSLQQDLNGNGFNVLFSDGTGVKDALSAALLLFGHVASAVNYFEILNAIAGTNPKLEALGSDTDIGLDLIPKGAGTVRAGASVVPITDGTPSLGAAAARWLKLFLASGGIIDFNNGDVTITHGANKLTFAGASLGYTFDVAPDVGGSTVALLGTAGQAVTGGGIVTSKALGTFSSGTVTLSMGDRPLQDYTNNGAHTLAPGTNRGACILDITNGASAGAITTSGWTKVSGSFDTTNAHAFRCHCSVGPGGSLLVIQAMQ